jgi:hypothetical protein
MSNRTIPSHRQVELAINESFGSVAHLCARNAALDPGRVRRRRRRRGCGAVDVDVVVARRALVAIGGLWRP